MGMFDELKVLSFCPACGHSNQDTQTKDLLNTLAEYRPLTGTWWDPDACFGRAFREGLPVFPRFPHDRAHTVWSNQAEQAEAQARLPEDLGAQLKYVNVHIICRKCQVFYSGKVRVEKGMLIGDVFDITREGT